MTLIPGKVFQVIQVQGLGLVQMVSILESCLAQVAGEGATLPAQYVALKEQD